MPRPIRGRRQWRGVQIGQIEQQHLRPGHRCARVQPNPPLDQGLGSCMNPGPHQPDNADHCGSHTVNSSAQEL